MACELAAQVVRLARRREQVVPWQELPLPGQRRVMYGASTPLSRSVLPFFLSSIAVARTQSTRGMTAPSCTSTRATSSAVASTTSPRRSSTPRTAFSSVRFPAHTTTQSAQLLVGTYGRASMAVVRGGPHGGADPALGALVRCRLAGRTAGKGLGQLRPGPVPLGLPIPPGTARPPHFIRRRR